MSHTPSTPRLSLLGLSMPVAMGYIPLGAVYGFLFVQAGGAPLLALASSLIVYAGAAQYMAIPMLAGSVSLGALALATLIVNLRHVFYGLSLLHRRPPGGLGRWYMVFGLTDETYSVLTTLPADTPPGRLVLLTLLNQGWWVLGTLLGALLGQRAQLSLVGLDFALIALFTVLTVEQWRSRSSSLPLWWGLGAYGLGYLLAPDQALVIGIGLCVLGGLHAARGKAPEEAR